MERPLPQARVLVVGDVMLDRYLEETVRHISPEAPVPVVTLRRDYCSPGGAGHVAALLAGLGCSATVAGVVGSDPAGRQLPECLRAAGVQDRLVVRAGLQTVCKTRILAGAR